MTGLFYVAVVALLEMTTSCSNPINAHTGGKYYEMGIAAERSGNLEQARMFYSRAYGNAQMGNLDAKAKAYSLYEYSRMSGVLGFTSEAKEGYARVADLLKNADSEARKLETPLFVEWAHLENQKGDPKIAVELYKKADILLLNVNIVELDPIGYALFLEEYAKAVEKIGGSNAELKGKAAMLQKKNAGRRTGKLPTVYK